MTDGYAFAVASGIPGPVVPAPWLRERMEGDAPEFAVVDVQCRLTDPRWGRARYLDGHLPGAVFADMERDLSTEKTGTNGRHPLPSVVRMAEVFGRLGIGAETVVCAYDEGSGMFAARLWWMLRHLGHERVTVLDGGLPAWLKAGGALRAGEETRTARTFVPKPIPERAADVRALEAGLGGSEHLLLDAREPARWRGETEPFDPVAGRIPGARNHFWQENLDGNGRFRSPDELRRRFAPLASEQGGRRIVCYCGSGLTAALNALALELAGLPRVAVYSGSWSEWCADPARPVEREDTGASGPPAVRES